MGYSHCNKSENDCFTVKPDPRSGTFKPPKGKPDQQMLLFPSLTFAQPGRISSISYFATKAGEAYISFWRHVPDNLTQWAMVGKVPVEATDEGMNNQVVEENIYVSIGDAIAIHYPLTNESSSRSARGVVGYEYAYSDRNIPDGLKYIDYKHMYKKRYFDNGWKVWNVQNFDRIHYSKAIPLLNISIDCLQNACPDHWYGPDCRYQCFATCKDQMCSSVNGECLRGCEAGYMGSTCHQKCPGQCKGSSDCDRFTGMCSSGLCADGYIGELCNNKCPFQMFGQNCSSVCNCANDNQCDHVTGRCPDVPIDENTDGSGSCKVGWTGCSCSTPIHHLQRNSLVMQVLTPILIVLLVIAIAVNVYLLLKIKYGFSMNDTGCCRRLSSALKIEEKGVRFSNPLSISSSNFEPFNGDEVSVNHERQPSNGK